MATHLSRDCSFPGRTQYFSTGQFLQSLDIGNLPAQGEFTQNPVSGSYVPRALLG